MTSMEIYYSDLNTEAQKEFDEKFGPPGDHNHDVIPVAVYQMEEINNES